MKACGAILEVPNSTKIPYAAVGPMTASAGPGMSVPIDERRFPVSTGQNAFACASRSLAVFLTTTPARVAPRSDAFDRSAARVFSWVMSMLTPALVSSRCR